MSNLILKTKNERKGPFLWRRRRLNEEFFSEINSPEKAYWLGFLYADGCVQNGRYLRIMLNGKDVHHLRLFKKAIECDYKVNRKIYHRVKARKNKSSIEDRCWITVCSKRMVEGLIKCGCLEKKTYSLFFPTEQQVSALFLSHFLRGFFDGDGSICLSKNGKRNGVQRFRWEANFVSTKEFILELRDYLFSVGIEGNITNNKTSKGISSIRISKTESLTKLKRLLYQNETISLKRKKLKFENYEKQQFLSKV